MLRIKVKLGIQGKNTLRMTIPVAVRDSLRWNAGDYVEIEVNEQQMIVTPSKGLKQKNVS